jgi:hypothetical protein
MKKNAPKIPSRADETLTHVKAFVKSDTPRWVVLAAFGVGLYAATRVVSHFIKSAGTDSDKPRDETEVGEMTADESLEMAKANPAKAGAGANGEIENDLAAQADASDEQRERAINNMDGAHPGDARPAT